MVFYVRSIDSKVESELICARSAAISTSLNLVPTIAFFALQRVFKCKYSSPRHKVANKWLFCLNYPKTLPRNGAVGEMPNSDAKDKNNVGNIVCVCEAFIAHFTALFHV